MQMKILVSVSLISNIKIKKINWILKKIFQIHFKDQRPILVLKK